MSSLYDKLQKLKNEALREEREEAEKRKRAFQKLENLKQQIAGKRQERHRQHIAELDRNPMLGNWPHPTALGNVPVYYYKNVPYIVRGKYWGRNQPLPKDAKVVGAPLESTWEWQKGIYQKYQKLHQPHTNIHQERDYDRFNTQLSWNKYVMANDGSVHPLDGTRERGEIYPKSKTLDTYKPNEAENISKKRRQKCLKRYPTPMDLTKSWLNLKRDYADGLNTDDEEVVEKVMDYGEEYTACAHLNEWPDPVATNPI